MDNTRGAQLLSSMSAADQKAVMQQLLDKQKAVTQDAYYSEVAFFGTIASNALTLAAGVRKAFAYKQGDPMNSLAIGYPLSDATNADDRHTNLAAPGQTVDNQKVFVYGVSILPRSDSDAGLLSRLLPQLSCRVQFGSKSSFGLGPIETIPGGGGMTGNGMSRLVDPPQNESIHSRIGAVSIGQQFRKNYRELKSPFIWNPQSEGSDSQLSVAITLPAAFTMAIPAARSAGTAVSAYAQPATGDWGTYIKLLVHLHSVQIANRSSNA